MREEALMLVTILCAFVAGFFVGNGLPYYIAGSTGEGTNPSPFSDSASVNVLVGLGALGIGALGWHFADVEHYRRTAYTVAALGILSVGLIHARLWRNDPWRKRR
jgi:hypothetical protein